MTFSEGVIVLAALAMATALGDMRMAIALFTTYCAQLHLPLPKNIPQFIRTWAPRLTPDGFIIRHAGNAGRPPSTSPQMVEAAYQAVINWKKAGFDRPFASIEQAVARSPEIQKVLRESGISPERLFDLMKEAHPHLRFGKITVRWKLTDDNKAERVSVCTTLKRMYRNLLHRLVFVDAKTICMCEEEIMGWVDTSVPGYAEGIRPATYKSRIIRLRYYAAVHCKLGPVFLKFYTGTSGMDHTHDGHNYRVSQAMNSCGAPPPLTCRTTFASWAAQRVHCASRALTPSSTHSHSTLLPLRPQHTAHPSTA